uniref:Angiopoietin like 4 n=1 Tax=Cyanistes caeruleus TaxID=156563 RepID=A0A8C0VJR4_CYACU
VPLVPVQLGSKGHWAATVSSWGPSWGPAEGTGSFIPWDQTSILPWPQAKLGSWDPTEIHTGQSRQRAGFSLRRAEGSWSASRESRIARPSLSFEAHLALLPQSLMDAQNLRIEELLQKVKQQQYKLDKQNLQIKSLQSKVSPCPVLQPPPWKWGLWPSPQLLFPSPAELPEGCHQLFLAGQQSSGVFQVQPAGSQPFKVYCDMTAEGGWTVIQRRMDGSVDFDQLWDAYKNGFGDLRGDFWLGLEKIHHLVQEGKYSLLIELEDWEGNSQVVQFVFSLGGESTAYTLNLLGPLSGELENAIGEFRQLPFSTRDRDHDLKADTNCAKHLSGGWWFSTCGHANLNGKYFRSIPRQRHERKQGIFWKTWKGRYYPLKSTIMKIQPAALEAET